MSPSFIISAFRSMIVNETGNGTNPLQALIGEEKFDLLMTEGVKPAVGVCFPSSCSPQELEVQ